MDGKVMILLVDTRSKLLGENAEDEEILVNQALEHQSII